MSQVRVVSLIASATEIVAALGCEDRLVGRSHECDHPHSIRALPACTAAKVDVSARGAEIDRQIKALLRNALSIYDLDTDALRRLKPDLIITQSQCEVCAVSLAEVERALCDVVSSRPRVVSLEPDDLDGIRRGILEVADALGVPERGSALVAGLWRRLDDIGQRVRRLQRRPTVACIEWIEPLMAAGNWVPELVALAGGVNLFGESGRHSPWLTWDDVAASDPDVIVVLPCGWDIARTQGEMGPLVCREGWPRLSAVRRGAVFLTDGNQFFNRPGPRVVESAEILAEILHPDEFCFGHEGTGWVRL